MLARLLEKLLSDEKETPQSRALRTLAVFALVVGMWLIFHQPDPTCKEETANVRAAAFREIIQRKELTQRNEYWLVMIRDFNRSVETPDLRFFFDSTFCRQVEAAGPDRFPFAKAKPASLPIFAQATDSLIKQRGELTIRVRRGNRFYTFEYRCPWSNPTL